MKVTVTAKTGFASIHYNAVKVFTSIKDYYGSTRAIVTIVFEDGQEIELDSIYFNVEVVA